MVLMGVFFGEIRLWFWSSRLRSHDLEEGRKEGSSSDLVYFQIFFFLLA